jgi:DNA-binding beta-propeller fold protein YncE
MDVDPNTGRLYVADASGVVWSTDSPAGNQRPSLGAPYKLPASSVSGDVAVDPNEGRVYVATQATSGQACPGPSARRSPGCIVVLSTNVDDASPPKLLAGIPLSSRPGELHLDADRGLLFTQLPDEQAIGIVDVRSGRLVSQINNLPQITSMALAADRQVLYAAHLGGQVTIIDTVSATVVGRVNVTDAGLTGVATARGLAYAINTSSHELAVIEPASRAVAHYPLSQEPAAVVASEASGAIFVLSSRSNEILRIDPTSGTEVGRVLLDDRGGRTVIRPVDQQTLRPQFVLNPADESVFVTLPDVGSLAAVAVDSFPVLANAIPYVELPDAPTVGSPAELA